MHIQQINRSELATANIGSPRGWLVAASAQLLDLQDDPTSRILIAVEGGRTRAILGLELRPPFDDCQGCATIRVLEVDPEHVNRGIASRLVRFAEGIAHINGCNRVQVASSLATRGSGRRCWASLGFEQPGAVLSKDIAQRFQRAGCA